MCIRTLPPHTTSLQPCPSIMLGGNISTSRQSGEMLRSLGFTISFSPTVHCEHLQVLHLALALYSFSSNQGLSYTRPLPTAAPPLQLLVDSALAKCLAKPCPAPAVLHLDPLHEVCLRPMHHHPFSFHTSGGQSSSASRMCLALQVQMVVMIEQMGDVVTRTCFALVRLTAL